ncbi:MAG: hypothetical protein GWM88_05355 [Pseudomonadales bacterium]|nr:hypothetical protein [Pseudomonadales bacterium]NIX07462.1 hypothetical protein [Pseudomonadales bacterium]
MGTITCSCGTVTLTLPNAVPKFRCGCCCTDCLQRAYLGCKGHPPEAIGNLEEPIDLLYVDSQLMKPDPEALAKLEVFKLNKPDEANVNLRATCCGSVLCTENEAFHVPHTMATFNNLRPFLACDFAEVPASRLYVWTSHWPVEKAKALAAREAASRGEALPQIFNVMEALTEAPIAAIAEALKIEASPKPEGSISFAELCESLETMIEHGYYVESRAHVAHEAT